MSPRTFARIAAVAAILGGLLFLFNVSQVDAGPGTYSEAGRIACGNTFTNGDPLKTSSEAAACADKETPKKLAGGVLVVLGGLAFAGTYVRSTRRPAAR